MQDITGRDGDILCRALAYAISIIDALPQERQESSDRDDMAALLATMQGEHHLAGARAHLGLETHFIADPQVEAESRQRVIENLARELGVKVKIERVKKPYFKPLGLYIEGKRLRTLAYVGKGAAADVLGWMEANGALEGYRLLALVPTVNPADAPPNMCRVLDAARKAGADAVAYDTKNGSALPGSTTVMV